MGDDPRIPLATDEVMGPEAKRKKEDAEDPRAPKDTKKKLERVFHVEDKNRV